MRSSAAPADPTAQLGPALQLWNALIADLAREHGIQPEGWVRTAFPLRLGKRRIVYLAPREGWFLTSFALGDRAVDALKAAKLPVELGKRYAEGTAVRLEVRNPPDLKLVKQIVLIKLEPRRGIGD
jgi:hypothetical protein